MSIVRLGLALAFLLTPLALTMAAEKTPTRYRVYVGTYTGKESEGIYRFDLDLATGKLSNKALAGKAVNPSFLAIHPNKRFLYAVGEVNSINGKKGGGISAFAIDAKTGDLKLLNQESSGGAGPCHVTVDASGKNVLAANYGGGSACVLPIGPDGKVSAASAFVQHKGKSVNKSRQEAPHAHSVNLDPANQFAFVADLGLDKVLIYRFDSAKGTIVPNDPPHVELAPGAGPRHFAFHPSGKFAYVINELDSTVTALKYDDKKGALEPIHTLSTLPQPTKGNSTAEVVVHPSGKFLYGSNRGHDSIAIFAIDQKTGRLTAKGHQGSKIKTPRNFAIEPTGKYLIVANQDGGSLLVFRIDQETGALEPTGHEASVGRPVCVRFLPIEE